LSLLLMVLRILQWNAAVAGLAELATSE